MKPKLLFFAAGFFAGFIPAGIWAFQKSGTSVYPSNSGGVITVESSEVVDGGNAALSFEAGLEMAHRLYQGKELDRHRLKVEQLLDDCAGKWADTSQLILLGQAAHRLPFSSACLQKIARRMAQRLSISEAAAVLMGWRCQPDAEELFKSLPDHLRRSLSLEPGLLTGLFGGMAAERFDQIWTGAGTKELPSLDQAAGLLLTGALGEGWFGKILQTKLKDMDAQERSRKAAELMALLPRFGPGEQQEIWREMCRAFTAPELATHVRAAARLSAPDLMLQNYGETLSRAPEPLTAFLKEAVSWHSEASRREMLKGFLSEVPSLDGNQAALLKQGIDDTEMRNAIDVRVFDERISREGPAVLPESGFSIERQTEMALQSMKKWPEETVRMALEGKLDLKKVAMWRKANPELYPLSAGTAAQLAEQQRK